MEKNLFKKRDENGKWGFVDEDGNWVIEPKFVEAFDFHEGFSMVKIDGKWGYIKTDGTYLVEPKFDYAQDFKNGTAYVELEGEEGTIDTDGKYIPLSINP